MNKIKVIYHANCNDGFCAAYLLWQQYKDLADYIPMHYKGELDTTEFTKDTIVYIVDFSFPRETMVYLGTLVKQIWVLDHHKTAEAALKDLNVANINVIFDMEKSGAQLTFDFLHRHSDYSPLVKYTADRDLWKWELPDSKEINAYIATLLHNFEQWSAFEIALDIRNSQIVFAGRAILEFQQRQIDNAVRNAVECRFVTGKITAEVYGASKNIELTFLAVNSTVNFSEVAGELAAGRIFGLAWFQRSDGKFQYSLRSDSNGFDVAELAKKFGGGGHKHAAGFESDVQILERV